MIEALYVYNITRLIRDVSDQYKKPSKQLSMCRELHLEQRSKFSGNWAFPIATNIFFVRSVLAILIW